MPWTSKDAFGHTHKAKSAKSKRQWAKVADSMLARGKGDAAAIRAANAVVARRKQEGGAAGDKLRGSIQDAPKPPGDTFKDRWNALGIQDVPLERRYKAPGRFLYGQPVAQTSRGGRMADGGTPANPWAAPSDYEERLTGALPEYRGLGDMVGRTVGQAERRARQIMEAAQSPGEEYNPAPMVQAVAEMYGPSAASRLFGRTAGMVARAPRMLTSRDDERAAGGGIQAPSLSPSWTEKNAVRSVQRGMLHSTVPGRTDKLPVKVGGGSYVFPADTVSAIGQGNSMAGAKHLDKMFSGARMDKYGGGRFRMPGVKGMRREQFSARGGGQDDETPIVAAGGEYIASPEDVAHIGDGDVDRGHNILDDFVLAVRKHHIDTLKKLKPPKKD